MSETPSVIHKRNILLTPHGNGGWTVEIQQVHGTKPVTHGAYTNMTDLMHGLKYLIENGVD